MDSNHRPRSYQDKGLWLGTCRCIMKSSWGCSVRLRGRSLKAPVQVHVDSQVRQSPCLLQPGESALGGGAWPAGALCAAGNHPWTRAFNPSSCRRMPGLASPCAAHGRLSASSAVVRLQFLTGLSSGVKELRLNPCGTAGIPRHRPKSVSIIPAFFLRSPLYGHPLRQIHQGGNAGRFPLTRNIQAVADGHGYRGQSAAALCRISPASLVSDKGTQKTAGLIRGLPWASFDAWGICRPDGAWSPPGHPFGQGPLPHTVGKVREISVA